jgi:NADH pyrophosphatase NudC (nudix superfamily)
MAKTFLDKRYCSWCGGRLKKAGQHQLTCQKCHTSEYDNPRAAVALMLINDQGKILLARRSKDPSKGKLDIPGGFMDGLEDPKQAVLRRRSTIFSRTR